MPYIEVWIDDDEHEVTQLEKEVERLEGLIKEAASLLRDGLHREALHCLTDDRTLGVKSPDRIAKDYKAWKAGLLDGFIPPAL